ncbi:hypothetical protein ACWD0J_33100 [Streptomyces sp. NPDC003011]
MIWSDGVNRTGEAVALTASSTRFTAASGVRPPAHRPGSHAVCEVGPVTHLAWEQKLHQLDPSDEEACHLELPAVTFTDVVGVSALAVAAQGLVEGRRTGLAEPPAAPRRGLDISWPDLPAVEVVAR